MNEHKEINFKSPMQIHSNKEWNIKREINKWELRGWK